MYEEYWGLKEKPFENTPDPRFLYHSPKHEEALTRLLYAIRERKGAAVLTGEFGAGKTILSRALRDELQDHERYRLIYITNTQIPAIEFIREIMRQLGEPEERLPEKKSDLWDLLGKILERNANIGRDIVIIIDEAQLIEDRETFEELRLLLNFQSNERFLLTLLLLGQPELREKIANLPQLKQRLSVRYHLSNLDEKETGEYINHRLKIAGQKREIFDSETIPLIHHASQGSPREINNICDLSLLTGMGREVDKIDEEIIREVTKDLEG